tara:strand:+ start:2184 stop:3098 length:915 start_codon:yes stop_codon:yes gene_type:complete
MLYDRPYMREPQKPTSAQHKSAVTVLMALTIGVFALQQLFNVLFPSPYLPGTENAFMAQWFALSGENFRSFKVWTLFTYCFLHSTQGFMHIIGNMLGLYFIGRILEPQLGREKFLILYFAGALFGGLLYLIIHFSSMTVVVGASAAVFALMTVFCKIHPDRPITLLLFFVLPVTIKPRYLLLGSSVISVLGLLFYELPNRSNMAHSAHLGGILLGVLFYRTMVQANSPFSMFGIDTVKISPPDWMKRRKKDPSNNLSYSVNRASRNELQKEIDRILDKINTSGFGSLNDMEKATLERAKDLLSK